MTTHPADCPGLRTALEHLTEAAAQYLAELCCVYHDANGHPCAPDDQGGYCCDNCPTLAAAEHAEPRTAGHPAHTPGDSQ